MRRLCETCGKVYEAKRSTSRFCGSTCRVRNSRGTSVTQPVTLPRQETTGPALSAAVEAELRSVGRVDTFLGQTALALARRIEEGGDTGSAVAALSREMRAAVADAMKGAGAPQSAVAKHRDELAARRRGA